MKGKLFPYCLERSTNVKKSVLKKMECEKLLSCALEYKKAMEEQAHIIAEYIKVLENAYSLCQNPEILKAKRKMAVGKIVTRTDVSLGELCDQAIRDYNEEIRKTREKLNTYQQLYAECLLQNRQGLRSFIEENELVLRTLPLINKDFHCKLEKYRCIPVDEHNAKIRKLDHQLIRLLTRATMKTSPFSFLTSVCLYDPLDEHSKNDKTIRSLCEINYYIVKAIYDFIIEKPHFAKQISYRLNAFKEYEDSYVFLYQKDYEKGKVYKTVDGMVRLKKNSVLELVVKQMGGHVFHFNDLVKLFVDAKVEENKAVEIIYEKLILGKIITPDVCIDDTKGDIYEEFFKKTSELIDDEEKSLHKIAQNIRTYRENADAFILADWQKRFEIIHTLNSQVAEIEEILQRKFDYSILLYEDSVYEKPRNPIQMNELKNYDLDYLQRFFSLFDQGILTYLLFSEMFATKYGKEKVNAADIDVYKLFVEAASKLTNVWRDNFCDINFETEYKIQKITQLKKDFFAYIEGKKQESCPQDMKDFVDKMVEDNPDIFDKRTNSATFFFQTAENGEMVINKVYKGQLLFFTRFLKLFSEDSEEIKEYCKVAFGKEPLEITESFGFNANVHRKIFDKRLVLNLTDLNDRCGDEIFINECYFYYDEEQKLVKLANESMGEVNGVYLGSLAYNLMPVPLRTVNGMQPTTRFDTSYLNLWDTTKKDELVADHYPRMQYGNIVFMRQQYLLNSIYDLSQKTEDLYVEIVNDFQKAGLPRKFFIRPYLNGADFDFYNMGRTTLKPQYIDLSSPLLFQELLREMEKHKQFVLEELYPDNASEDFIYEYQIERTLYE